MTPPFPQSFWLEPERILCGEYPRTETDGDEPEKMRAIIDAGCRVFINLTGETWLKPYEKMAREVGKELAPEESLEFYQIPIRDMGVPNSADEMRAVLREIRSALHRDQPVYIHCWGGIGRTGIAAGCALMDSGDFSPEGALEYLNDCWKENEKSVEHPKIPQTQEQTDYIQQWEAGRPDRGTQIRSAILGAAVGDALGVPVEFQSREARKKDPVTGMREYGTHHQPAGTWSDDTSMIVATLFGIATAGDYDAESVMAEFGRWANEAVHTPHGKVFDIGNATSQAIRTGEPGSDEYSNGNGSLMRILPIALLYPDDPELLEKACEISALTHAHERSLYCCAFYCLVVSELLHHETLKQATAFAWRVMDDRWDFLPDERSRFDALHPDKLFARTEDEIGSSGHVIDTLEAALWVNAQHDNYADTVLHAVNLGDDTDTTGCVAGGLAGLIYGEESIPAEWLETLVEKDLLLADIG